MPNLVVILIALLAFALGYLIAWALNVIKRQSQQTEQLTLLDGYIKKELHDELQSALSQKNDEITHLSAETARQHEVIRNLQEKLEADKKQLEELQGRFTTEFENLANRIFTEKAEAITTVNAQKLESIIKPFNEKINAFGKKVEETYINGTQERHTLKEQLAQLMQVNHQLSDDAIRLTQALKGDSQFQGSWGEVQLQRLLESAGMQEGVHFSRQDSLRDEEGNLYRTDIVIHLPDDKHLILDSKVSLAAFEGYFNADTDEDRQRHLDAHLVSIKNHIGGLSDKNYPKLNGINPPDYVLMFMPLEPAFIAAVQADPKLYEKALEKNIAIVSPSTLMATLRTITYIWKNENQARNVIAIAREAGGLYDKFVGFLEDMQTLGRRLDSAQREYAAAMNKLSTSDRKGATIIGKVEKLREMGAETSKRIPASVIAGAVEGEYPMLK